MGQFKPMVKMYTDEPSVILKLKKGGKVHHKAEKKEEHGHKSMHHAHHGMHEAFESEHGHAPKKPSMHERRKAMNPNQYKKGGKVEHKLDGGMMGAPMGMPAVPQAMGRQAVMGMDPRARMARAAMVRKALTGMKKGGHMGMEKHIEKLEKELHHHESMPMDKAHKMHHKASGGAIDRDETRTTIKGNAKKYEKTMMVDGEHHDKHHGTGEIHEGKPAGFKHGGKMHKMHHKATGGAIPSDTHEKKNAGKIKMHGTIEGNERDYLNTEMHSAKRDKAHGTGGIKETNAGGFARGGKVPGLGRAIEGGDWENRPADTAHAGKMNGKTGEVHESNAGGFKHGGHASKKHYATGGEVDMGQADRTLRQSSRGETKLPDMRALNKAAKAMGYEHYVDVPDNRLKEFHELKKKHGYAKGGNVVDDGKAEKMPRHFVSRPVANSLQSGTFAKGGKVNFYSDLAKKMQKDPEKPNLRLVKTHTGPKGHVAKVYKDKDYGEYRTKFFSPEGKHHTEADSHTDDLEDAHMTAMHEVNKGYKRGGKISHKATGGLQDLSKGQYDRSIGPSEDEMDMARSIRNIPSKLFEGAKSLMGMRKSAEAGRGFVNPKSVTETEKSVTVAPRKRGGKC
jgi:hypothetical protein